MRTYNVEDDEIEVINDLRKIPDQLRRVIMGAIHSTAERQDPPPADPKVVPLRIPRT
jgi:hypothetical protein